MSSKILRYWYFKRKIIKFQEKVQLENNWINLLFWKLNQQIIYRIMIAQILYSPGKTLFKNCTTKFIRLSHHGFYVL